MWSQTTTIMGASDLHQTPVLPSPGTNCSVDVVIFPRKSPKYIHQISIKVTYECINTNMISAYPITSIIPSRIRLKETTSWVNLQLESLPTALWDLNKEVTSTLTVYKQTNLEATPASCQNNLVQFMSLPYRQTRHL